MDMNNLKQIQDKIIKCMGCGICRGIWDRREEAMCPVWATGIGFEDTVPRGRVTVAQDLVEGIISYTMPLAESVFRCTDCGTCAVICDATDPNTGEPVIDVPKIVRAMRADLVENSMVPPLVRDYFKAIYVNGNPYKEQQENRGKWADTIVERYSGHEYLFYVGDVGSFDERGTRMARAVAKLLIRAGVSIGIMGPNEFSDGNDVKVLGESGLFEHLAKSNIEQFTREGVKKIICLDPHSYNTFKNDYPGMGAEFELWHYTQVIAKLVKENRVSLIKRQIKVAYHDPCYLGRHNQIYDEPREILSSIPGLQLVEFKRSRKNSFCCGGGGGNFFTDLLGGGTNSPSQIRVREGLETGVDIIAVACPLCSKMLDDAIKAEGIGDKIEVKDIAEIVLDSIGQM